MRLEGKVALMSGASRGLGQRVALGLAAEGADVVIAARTEEENPRLPGTIHSAAEAVRALGRRALPVKMDASAEADKEPKDFTGRAVTDEEVLALEGITDLSKYETE